MNSIAAPYQLRARFCGVLDFTCPWCAQIVQAHSKDVQSPVHRKECRRWFGIGLVFHVLPRAGNGGSIPPEDFLIPNHRDPLPAAEIDEWRRGDPVHRVIES
jgi:hypothetical protein